MAGTPGSLLSGEIIKANNFQFLFSAKDWDWSTKDTVHASYIDLGSRRILYFGDIVICYEQFDGEASTDEIASKHVSKVAIITANSSLQKLEFITSFYWPGDASPSVGGTSQSDWYYDGYESHRLDVIFRLSVISNTWRATGAWLYQDGTKKSYNSGAYYNQLNLFRDGTGRWSQWRIYLGNVYALTFN